MKKTIIILLGIILITLLLRLYSLTVLPVFGDEAIYIRWAQVMRAEPELRFLPLSDGKQPLFMWAVIPFLKIFENPLFAGRLVSVIAGMGTMIGIFVLTLLLFGKSPKFKNFSGTGSVFTKAVKSLQNTGSLNIALIASAFYAFSPFSVFFDRIALVDSLLAMFGIWTVIFAVITVKKRRLDTAMLAGFALGGMMLVKSPGLFFAILLPSTWVLANWQERANTKEKFTLLSILLFLFTFTYLIAFGFYNILRLGPEFHMLKIRTLDYVYPLSHVFESPLDPLISHMKAALDYVWIMGPGLLFIFAVLGIWFNKRKYYKETLLLLIFLVIPILIVSEYSKTITARYIYFAMPYLYILSASAFTTNRDLIKRILYFGLALYLLLSIRTNYLLLTNPESAKLPSTERSGYLEEWTAGHGIKETADFIRNQHTNNPHEQIVVGTEGYFGTLPNGLQMYLNDIPEIVVIGVGLDLKGIPIQLKESKDAGNKTYLLINDSRLKLDVASGNKDYSLQLIREFPKAQKPGGSRERLLFFEVE
jgi:4-amino-4-deoxy-L-arabinose transferase-like glycosyltransferase